jgi:hypothetical protein
MLWKRIAIALCAHEIEIMIMFTFHCENWLCMSHVYEKVFMYEAYSYNNVNFDDYAKTKLIDSKLNSFKKCEMKVKSLIS